VLRVPILGGLDRERAGSPLEGVLTAARRGAA